MRFVLTKRRNTYGEYVIRAYDEQGHYCEEATYYTDDWEDALGTLAYIAHQESKTLRQTNTHPETWEVR